MAICLTNYKIVITFADKTQKVIDVQAAQQLKLPQGAVLTLVEVATSKPPAKLLTKRLPGQLVFELEGEGVIAQVRDSDASPAVVDNNAAFSPAIQQDITGPITSNSEICAPAAVNSASEAVKVGSWGFLGAGTAGAIGGAAALLSSKSEPMSTTVVARVVGGPVLAGNDMQATIYKADGVTVLGTGTIGADGTVSVPVRNYTGVVVVKVQNNGGPTDPDHIPDYMDEASAQGKDLGDAVLYSVGVLVQEGSTIYLNVNILTALAHLKATEIVGDGVPLDAATVRNTITAIADAFGLDDLTGDAIQTTVTQSGANSAQTANLYGEILAALSGADARNGGDTQQTLLDLASNINITGSTATLLATALEILIEGAKTADPSNTMGLVNTLSEATTLASPSVSIDSVGGNNYINASEASAGVTVSGTCVAGSNVSITVGSNVRTATVSGTTWSYALNSADFTAMGQGPETLLVTSTLNGQSASASRGVYIDTVAPSAPTVDTLLSNDTSPVITGSSTPSRDEERLTVTVNGATYNVTPNDDGGWSLDLGTATPASGSLGVLADGQTYQVVATVADAAGNTASDTSTNELVIDTSAPSLAIDPVSGGYINNAEDESAVTLSGTSNAEDGCVVTLTLAGQTYTATVNSGTWSTFISSNAIKALSAGTVTMTANVSDGAGNNALQATQSFVYDNTAPATPATPSAYDDGIGTQQNASSTASTTDDARPGLRVPSNLTDTLTLYVDGVTVDATYNASTGTLTPDSDLQDGAHALTYTLTDAAGNQSLPSGAFNLTIDTTAPTAAAPTAYIDDVGTIQNTFSTATHTDDVRPGLRISSNLTDTPKLYVDGVVVAATYNATTGALTPDSNLTEGAYAITYTLTDAAGNESAQSAALNITIDTTAPSAPGSAPDLPTSSDMGDLNTDNITNISRPGLQVGALPAGVTQIDLLVDGQVVAAVYDTQTGLLQPASTLSDGTYALTYRYTDAAGNQGGVSPVLNLTIDTLAPNRPSAAADLLSSNDSGSSSSDNNTSNNRPVMQVGALPSGVTGIELLVGGQKVAATYNSQTGQIRPDTALTNGVHAVTYRYLDLAGNASQASDPLSLTVDTTAPLNAAITIAAAGGINGTFEPGTSLSLTIAGQAVTGSITTNSNGTWQYVPSSTELTALRVAGTKELLLTATDTAGNTATNSKTVTEYDFAGPYIKEFIPADTGLIANSADGTATLNLVFSKEVVKGTGNIQLVRVDDPTVVVTIPVISNSVVIEGGNDVYITLPGLIIGRQYYVTLAAGTFVDLAGEAFAGQLTTGTSGWDFTAAAASIAPDFVAGDDLINASENSDVVLITGNVVSSAAILAAINSGNISVVVSGPSAVTATVVSYSGTGSTAGQFVFSVPASTWAEGTYGYTVSLAGGTGAASNITANYAFSGLGVDLTAPTMTASVLGAQDNVGSIMGNVWANSNTALSDDASPTLSGSLSAPLSGDARVVVYRQDVTTPSSPGALVRVTNSDGLKPAGTTWSVTDSGLQDGHSYKYLAYVEDAAGNRSSAGDFKTVSIDTQAPQAAVTAVTLSDDSGSSATDLITNVASQTLTGTLSHTLAGDEKLLASVNGGVAWLDITAAVNGTVLTWTGVTLPDGSSSVLFKSVDPAGNEGPLGTFNATLDTTAPNAPLSAPNLRTNDDRGVSNSDDITNISRPAFEVGLLPAGITGVELLVNGHRVTATYDSQAGTLRPSQALANGVNSISYRYTDAAGNQSGISTALSLTVDTVAPTSVQGLSLSTDTGTLNTDFVTNVASQTITATLGAPLDDGETVYGTLNLGSSWTDVTGQVSGGTLTWTGATLSGTNTIVVQVRDIAGNISQITKVFNLDSIAPTTTISALDINADTGESATDFVTKTASQTVTGTLNTALTVGEQLFGSVDNGATWINITNKVTNNTSINWTGATLDGTSSLKLQVRDLAGNAGTTATQAYTLDTTSPTTTVSGLDISADTGPSATDFVTMTAAQTVTGTLSAALGTGEQLYGSMNNGTTWTNITNKVTGTAISWDGATLSGGNSSIQLQVRDAAGNAGPSTTQNYTLEVIAPIGPVQLTALAAGVGGFVIDGQAPSDMSGFSVSSAGDVNGDGLDDLLVGAKGSDPSGLSNAGRSYVVFGKTAGTAVRLSDISAGSGGFVINGRSADEGSGTSVSNVGDVNGDGLADILVSSYSISWPSGAWNAPAYVVFGKTSTASVELSNVADGTGGFAISGRTGIAQSYQNVMMQSAVSGAGDVNGDGLADLILGTNYANTQTTYVVYGKTSGTTVEMSSMTAASQGFVISGSFYSSAGWSVSNAGDVNGDGYGDILIGAPYSNNTANVRYAGRSFVVFGQSANANVNLNDVIAGRGGFLIDGGNNDSMSGYTVSAAGDVNGDGLADVVVSAPFTPGINGNKGQVYVVHGKTSGDTINLANITNGIGGFVIQASYYRAGESVSMAGDINGDGLADLILGYKEGGYGEPVFVVYGKTNNSAVQLADLASSNGPGGFKINSYASNEVSYAGDVNGDGLDDLIVGVSGEASYAGAYSGRSYVIFGNTSGGAFSRSAVDWMGANGDDTYAASSPGQTLVGHQGNDTLSANGATVLYGGAGNDTFEIDAAMVSALATAGTNSGVLARVDGGTGIDTIKLQGASQLLDLTVIANQAASGPDGGSRIDSVEILDITGSGNNTLKLNRFDVIDMGCDSLFQTSGRQQLIIKGNSGDQVDLADGTGTTGWTQAASASLNSVSYDVWNHNTVLATVYVQSGVLVV